MPILFSTPELNDECNDKEGNVVHAIVVDHFCQGGNCDKIEGAHLSLYLWKAEPYVNKNIKSKATTTYAIIFLKKFFLIIHFCEIHSLDDISYCGMV